MSNLLPSLQAHAGRIAAASQPVILALGTAGLSGGAMTACALMADHFFHHRAARGANANYRPSNMLTSAHSAC